MDFKHDAARCKRQARRLRPKRGTASGLPRATGHLEAGLCGSLNANVINPASPDSCHQDSCFPPTSRQWNKIDLLFCLRGLTNPDQFNLQCWMETFKPRNGSIHHRQPTTKPQGKPSTPEPSRPGSSPESTLTHTPHLSQEVSYLRPDGSQLFRGTLDFAKDFPFC